MDFKWLHGSIGATKYVVIKKKGVFNMFCSKCGKEIGEGVAFCQHCGNPVNAPVDATESIKNNAGSFLRSIQVKAKGVSESINTAAEEAKKKSQEAKQSRRFKTDGFSYGYFGFSGKVIVDRLTGVNYLFAYEISRDISGLTVLVDENGKPLVTKEDKIEITDIEENELEQNEENNAE